MPENKEEKLIFALLFASGDPVTPEKLANAAEMEKEKAEKIIENLQIRLKEEDSPLEILKLGDSFQLCVGKEYENNIKILLNSKRNTPLSQAALEVLASVAYNEPVTRGYIEEVRGIDSSSIVQNLVEKDLLCEAGRLDLPGKPIAYKTTANFLRVFGLSDLSDLPDLEEKGSRTPPEDFVEGQTYLKGEDEAQ